MNMQDGLLVKWLKREGEVVQQGEPLAEIETAKISSELESPASGLLAQVLVPEGQVVPVGAILAVIAAPGEAIPSGQAPLPATTAAPPTKQPSPREMATAQESKPAAQVTPVARKLAREHSIDLAGVLGSGPGGRIVEADIQALIEVQARPVARVVPLTGLRATIAARMLQSLQSMAQVTLTTEVDITEAVQIREGLLSQWRPQRLRPLDLDLVLFAISRTLTGHPRLNATVAGQEVRLAEEVNLGVATALREGLIVPVIHRADEKGLLEIARELRELTRKAQDGALARDDVMGATFTVSTLASYDIDAFTPIIDPPQVAILGIGRVVEKPAVYEGQMAIRSMMFLSLTFDHRAVDGAPAAEFLRALKQRLESPRWMIGG
jgi:pyruvate dehydrogenase E2 component (dihydrolipoamide acetyltransferase)